MCAPNVNKFWAFLIEHLIFFMTKPFCKKKNICKEIKPAKKKMEGQAAINSHCIHNKPFQINLSPFLPWLSHIYRVAFFFKNRNNHH